MFSNYMDMTESGFNVPKPYFINTEEENKPNIDEVADIEKKFKLKCAVESGMRKRTKREEAAAIGYVIIFHLLAHLQLDSDLASFLAGWPEAVVGVMASMRHGRCRHLSVYFPAHVTTAFFFGETVPHSTRDSIQFLKTATELQAAPILPTRNFDVK
ncbi:hypothetical protein CBL_20142 [Carabus blaptoides fortunei]